MTPAGRKKKKGASGRTPGRRERDQQFFEPGKVGRKTGITLKDTGIRDEHGMEPVSGIFSSPAADSPNRSLPSSDMHGQESSSADVTETLISRGKTPRLPLPRSATPKHTNIGSPKRMSTASKRAPVSVTEHERSVSRNASKNQPINRVLDYGVSRGIDSPSPFKPKKTLRRSVVPHREDPFAPTETSAVEVERIQQQEYEEHQQDYEDAQPAHEEAVPDDYNEYNDEPDMPEAEASELANSALPDSPSRRRSMKSHLSLAPNSTRFDRSSVEEVLSSGSRKRSRTFHDDVEGDVSISIEVEDVARPNKRERLSCERLSVHQDADNEPSEEQAEFMHDERSDQQAEIIDDEPSDLRHETIDPSMLTNGDGSAVSEEAPEVVVEVKTKSRSKGKKAKAAPKERDPNRSMNRGSPSKSPSKGRAGSQGPVSNVHLRSTTPFEDAAGRTSRYGRTLTQPLKYWANETRVWKEGEIEGIVRADDVEKPSRGTKGRKKRKGRKHTAKLEDIEEESEAESILPDEWEDDLGVIAGSVARYDPETEMGDPEDPVREDLAFAACSIATRDVLDGDFRYAKIVTMPFFGCGLVELPPGGHKKTKSSRKMQMTFFVHEGKVLVEVGAKDMEVNRFTLSKGGVWVVPRGNFYAIDNESKTTTARIFFAQGCEVDLGAASRALQEH